MTQGTSSATHNPRIVFTFRDFRCFLLARLLLVLGWQMQSLGVGWQIYKQTHEKIYLGYIGLAIFLPNVAFSLLTGHTADRFDRRQIVRVCQAIMVLCSLGLAFLSLHYTRPPLAAIYGLLFTIGTAQAFLSPASQSLLPHIIPREHFSTAVAWTTSIWHMATIVGPSLGGFIYAGGPAAVYFTGAALIAGAFVSMSLLHARTGRSETQSASMRTVLAGVHYVWKQKVILGCISLDLFAVLLGGAVALMPAFADDILHVGPFGAGMLRGAPALGAVLMTVVVTHLPPMKRAGAAMLWSVAGFGAATIVFGISKNFYLSLFCLALLGALDMISVIVRHTLVQILTPKEMLGRVSAVNMVFIGASNELGEFESGVTAQWWGTVPATVVGGIGTIVCVILWALLFPEMRRIKRLDQSHPQPTPQKTETVAP